MINETVYIQFSGPLADDQSAPFLPAIYTRTIDAVTVSLPAGTTPAAHDVEVQLSVGGVLQDGTYTLPTGQTTATASLDAPLELVPGAALAAVVAAAGGASDVTVKITSQVDPNELDSAWVLFTPGSLQGRITALESNTFLSSLLNGTQADPMPEIAFAVCKNVRNAVLSGSKSPLGPEGTIPASLLDDAVAIAKFNLFGSATAMKDSIDALRSAAKMSLDKLEKIARGAWRIEEPENPITTEKPNRARWGSDPPVDL
jgi:mRNA-degrading endonuclease toxin of MazEF toxin-antitoxin module